MTARSSSPELSSPRQVEGGSLRPRRAILAALLLIGTLPGAGCGGDNSPSPIDEVCVEFAPDQAPAAGTLTPVLVEGSTCETIFVDLLATDVNDVFGLDTVLSYDSELVRFRGWSNAGSYLRNDGAELATLINENAIGEITIGMSRVLVQTGVDIAGPETLLRLEFDIATGTAQTGDVELRADCLLDSQDPPQSIQGVTCVGGTLTVR
jgi:hypothetical protein